MNEASRIQSLSQVPDLQAHCDAVIIGAGVSGLAAAVELSNKGARVVLLEQTEKLGGRCYSYIDVSTGDIVDNGQHILVGAYRHTLRYLDMIGTRHRLRAAGNLRLPLHHPTKGFAAFEISSLPRPLDISTGMLKFKLLSLGERRRLLNVARSLQKWDGATVGMLAHRTVEEWLTSEDQSENAKNCLWYPIAISVMNETPQRASALLFARSLRDTFLGESTDSHILIPATGQSQLYVDGALKYLQDNNAVIMTGAEVSEIISEKNGVRGVSLRNGQTIRSRNVISAIPYFALFQILPPALLQESPFDRVQEFRSVPIVAIHLWLDADVMPMEYVGLIGKKIQWLFNRRKLIEHAGTHKGYLTAIISGAYKEVNFSKQDLVSMALDEIHEVFPESAKARLLHSLVIKEKRATFSATNEIEALRPSTKTPLSNLFLAGDWTDTGLPATIEGAVMSGFTAAQEAR
ncbi:MAG TPA: hydroxysqualene dehydroxylase HpnE [Bacteroidota bacterium]|nr:hydroxysqualene dehydroxylase HpnE [Bacteroidota bacterium]